MDFKYLRPKVGCAVGFRELFSYRERRGHLAEYIDEELRKLSKAKSEKYDYTVRIDEDGDIVCEGKELDFLINSTKFSATTMPLTSFELFEKDVPYIFALMLNCIERKNISFLGMIFKCEFLIKKEDGVIDILKNRFFQLGKEELSILKIAEDDVSRLSFELRFKEAFCLRHLIVRVDKSDGQNDKALISLDSRIEEEEKEVKDSKIFSEFFKKTAYEYFLNIIANKFLKEIFEIKIGK